MYFSQPTKLHLTASKYWRTFHATIYLKQFEKFEAADNFQEFPRNSSYQWLDLLWLRCSCSHCGTRLSYTGAEMFRLRSAPV